MSFKAHIQRNSGRAVGGAKLPGKAGGVGGPPGPPMGVGNDFFTKLSKKI